MIILHIPDEHYKKLDIKSWKCIFLDYSIFKDLKVYFLYNRTKKKNLISQNVVFDENILLQKVVHQHINWKNFIAFIDLDSNNNLVKTIIELNPPNIQQLVNPFNVQQPVNPLYAQQPVNL